jgi:hypothetical protein
MVNLNKKRSWKAAPLLWGIVGLGLTNPSATHHPYFPTPQCSILHAQFSILHSPFSILHSQFSITDSLLFLEKQKIAPGEGRLPARTLAIAHSFLGTPYVSGVLDRDGQEQLVLNLRALDCWTFVELSYALAQTGGGTFADFKSRVQQLRYWGGVVQGYGSRIHYFSGWLLQAEKAGFLRDLTRDMGGVPYRKKIGYISARPARYPKMRDKTALRALLAAEKRINAHAWYYIPKKQVAQVEQFIQEGDIVSLCSAKPDLDIAHQGFAVKINGRIHLMHASSLAKKVIVSKQPLPAYVASQRGQSGIMVARLNP